MEVNSTVTIKKNSLIRRETRASLKGNWLMAILLCVVYSIIAGMTGGLQLIGEISGLVLSMVASLVISGPLVLGFISFFMKLVRSESPKFEDLFNGFSNFKSSFLAYLLVSIFTVLWSMLLVVPGIIASYRYSMTLYILNDHPEMGAMEAIKASKDLMKGYKWKLFCLHLSFIGWGILSIFPGFFIGFLWLTPYFYASQASFYQNLKEVKLDKTLY